MNFHLRKLARVFLSGAFLCVTLPGWAQKPHETKVANYAPVKEAEAQLAYYLESIQKDLAQEQSYGADQQRRVALDASTVAVLALTLGMHEEPNKYQKSAAKLVELATELADNAGDYEAAKETLDKLKKTADSATADSATADGRVTWEPVGELVYLMQQVPIVNAPLRRGVYSRRFDRSLDRTAGHAVTLAAIAQASMLDTTYCGDQEDAEEWRRICIEMRDASAQVYKALQAKDQEEAKVGAERIAKTCDACHHRFRD